jgi:hypothetical protein
VLECTLHSSTGTDNKAIFKLCRMMETRSSATLPAAAVIT